MPATSPLDDRPNLVADAGRSASEPWRDLDRAPLIRIEEVSKRFGPTVALDRVSLDVQEGEFFCLLGPSGCGKSTLMRLIAGFERADVGRVLLGPEDLAGVPPHRRPVNMMFQSYALFPHMNVASNIAYGLKREGLARREIAARVDEMLRLVQLEGLGPRRPDHLSGGQRQRVALARALAKRPKVLLLDEPLAALDKKLREETQIELMGLQKRLGTTFVVVTHDQQEAMAMASRIAVMDRGRVVQVGSPAEVYERPRTRFVAEFIGDINLFSGRVEAAGGSRLTISVAGWPTPIAVDAAGSTPGPGEAVSLAVRPERTALHLDPVSDRSNVAAELLDTIYRGDRVLHRARLGNGDLVKVAEPNAGTDLRPVEPGRRVFLSFEPASAVVLAS